jgi:hypothetical protein
VDFARNSTSPPNTQNASNPVGCWCQCRMLPGWQHRPATILILTFKSRVLERPAGFDHLSPG